MQSRGENMGKQGLFIVTQDEDTINTLKAEGFEVYSVQGGKVTFINQPSVKFADGTQIKGAYTNKVCI